ETMFVAKPIAETAGFKFWKPLIWDKRKIGMGYHYRARYECILFFEKGKRRLADLGVPDVLEVPRIYNGYPTEKPVGFAETLIRQSREKNDLVIDPFMGAGSTGVAALNLGRRFAEPTSARKPCGSPRRGSGRRPEVAVGSSNPRKLVNQESASVR